MPTNPAPIAAAPDAPDRADRATFDSRATAWATYQKDTLVPGVNAHTAATYANAVEALAAAETAGAAATAAVNASNAAEWNPATNYAVGVVVWSPTDLLSYRRKVAGVSATDPSLDAVNWAPLAAGAAGAADVALAAGAQLVLTSASDVVQRVTATGLGASIKLPDATGLAKGPDKAVVVNAGAYPLGVLDGADQIIGQILGGDTVRFHLSSVATAAGAWEWDGNVDPWWLSSEVGTDAFQSLELFRLTADATLLVYRDLAGYPCVRYVAHPAGGAVSVGAAYVLEAASNQVLTAGSLLLDASRALLLLSSGKFALVDFSAGPTLTVGAAVAHGLGGVFYSEGGIKALDTRYVVACGYSGVNHQAVCLDCGAAGTTITMGAVVAQATSTGESVVSLAFAHRVSGTQLTVVGLVNAGGGSYRSHYARTVTRGAGTNVTWGATPANPAGWNTVDTPYTNFQATLISGDAYLCAWTGGSGANQQYGILTCAAVPAWSSVIASGMTANGSNTAFVKVTAAGWLMRHSGTIGKLEYVSVAGGVVSKALSPLVDATATGNGTVDLVSTVDGRGIFTYTAGSVTKVSGFAIAAGAIVWGSAAQVQTTYTFGVMSTTSWAVVTNEAAGTVRRLNYGQVTANSAYSGSYARLIEISAAGELTYGAAVPVDETAVLSSTTSPPAGGRVAFSSTGASGMKMRHCIVNAAGRLRQGRSVVRAPSFIAGNLIRTSAEMLAHESSNGTPGGNATLSRWRFAEV